MKIVKFGEIQTMEFMNQSISGFMLPMYAIHTTTNTAFSADLLLLKSVQLTCTLVRNGQTYVLANDNMRNWFARTVYGQQLWTCIATNQSNAMKVLVAGVTGVKAQVLVPFYVALPGIVNLKGSDKLTFQVNMPSAAGGTGVDTTLSFVQADSIAGVGVEFGIPFVYSDPLQAAVSNYSKDLGNSVTRVLVFNFDKRSYLAADVVVNSLQLTSDKLAIADTSYELAAKGSIQGYIPDATFDYFQSFQIYSGRELDNVSLNLQLTSANVTASENWIIWDRFMVTAATVERGARMRLRHQEENMSKIGVV